MFRTLEPEAAASAHYNELWSTILHTTTTNFGDRDEGCCFQLQQSSVVKNMNHKQRGGRLLPPVMASQCGQKYSAPQSPTVGNETKVAAPTHDKELPSNTLPINHHPP